MTEPPAWTRKVQKRYRISKPRTEVEQAPHKSHLADSLVYDAHVGRKGHAGAWAEMMACAWLLKKGYEVFRNVAPSGPADLVIMARGHSQLLDVKLCRVLFGRDGQPRINLSNQLTDRQISLGVTQFFVTTDGVCGFDAQTIRETYRRTYLLRGPMTVSERDA